MHCKWLWCKHMVGNDLTWYPWMLMEIGQYGSSLNNSSHVWSLIINPSRVESIRNQVHSKPFKFMRSFRFHTQLGACMLCVLGHHVETHARETGHMPANPTDGWAAQGFHCIYYMYFMWLMCRRSWLTVIYYDFIWSWITRDQKESKGSRTLLWCFGLCLFKTFLSSL